MSLFSLGAMVLWGMVLCFGYQLFLPHAEKSRTLLGDLLLYGGAGLVCFLSTALYLYAISGGEWGIYGFLAMLLGFGVYYRFFRRGGRQVADALESVFGGVRRQSGQFGRKLTDTAVFPFGKIVDKGVTWAEKREKEQEKEIKTDHGDTP